CAGKAGEGHRRPRQAPGQSEVCRECAARGRGRGERATRWVEAAADSPARSAEVAGRVLIPREHWTAVYAIKRRFSARAADCSTAAQGWQPPSQRSAQSALSWSTSSRTSSTSLL